jgi:hypothetical protein
MGWDGIVSRDVLIGVETLCVRMANWEGLRGMER